MARTLEASGTYRVLRRLGPHLALDPPPDEKTRQGSEGDLTKSVDPAALGAAALLEAAEEATIKAARGWILRMLRWGAGASNADLIISLLDQIGLRQSRRFVEEQGEWLASRGYLATRQFEMVTVYELTRVGDEVARGLVMDEGIAAIQLADVLADEKLIKSFRSR